MPGPVTINTPMSTQAIIDVNNPYITFIFGVLGHLNVNSATALIVNKSNITIDVFSSIQGGFDDGNCGVSIAGIANAVDNMIVNIADTGAILGDEGIRFGSNLDAFTLTNAGHILGISSGVDVLSTSGKIINDGFIDKITSIASSIEITNRASGVINNGIYLDGPEGIDQYRDITNYGTINPDWQGTAIYGSTSADSIQNSGIIKGNIYLQDGSDFFQYIAKEVGTSMAGTVYGGLGDDQYLLSKETVDIREAKSEGFDTINVFLIDKYILPDNVYVELVNGDLKILKGNSLANGINGGSHANSLYGMDGNDFIRGLEGDDYLDGGKGNDTLGGGFGNDTYIVDSASDVIIENDANSDGIDTVRSTASAFKMAVGVENIVLLGKGNIKATGNGLANSMIGNSGANSIGGGAGNDVLFGKAGKDILKGDAGSDKIDGGAGIDKLYGGAGADKFIFHPHDTGKTKASADTIYDFATGDRIDLQLIDASTRSGGDQHFKFIGHAGFHHKAGELRYDRMASDTYIYGDMNGDGKADLVIHLDDAKTMSGGNFVL